MREIKFRAWDKEREFMTYEPYYFEKYHYSDENRVNQSTYVFYEDWRDLEDGRYHECELMQYTGLKDKNGKEIYEGDIIRMAGKFWYVVRFEDAKFVCYHTKEEYGKWGDLHRLFDHDFSNYGWSVVGNIYGNPELLNQGV